MKITAITTQAQYDEYKARRDGIANKENKDRTDEEREAHELLAILLKSYADANFTLNVEVKPGSCPFCDGVRLSMDLNRLKGSFVSCLVCGGQGPHGLTPEDAVKAWNKRREGGSNLKK